ncbi:MAG: bifunctional pyr operon transcriptional regulator/uracil phosphoribosyltransferase PyrR [Selenomonadaceae bacterium]|nr:bifunctional pyr operon transcriptional regulator/uracil phosphoribosyltransferase PyrR [Selenomonadaceae bacterium]MBP3723782.1 bifunctional pyr operon transcriptional regulator/uracil phosphoribosyltransferase PyrR [Selenomonadaceae bacterium]
MKKLTDKTTLMDEDAMNRAIRRIAHEILERNQGASDLMLVGIRSRGVPLAEKLQGFIEEIENVKLPLGILDISLYRDDLSTLSDSPIVKPSSIPEDLNGKTVILVDDVLFTGRTILAALDAIMDMGRPKAIELAVLIDRGHREFPIRADFVGKNVPTSKKELISVQVAGIDAQNAVVLKAIEE